MPAHFGMACSQVDFVQALLPEFLKKLYHQNQNKCCTEIPGTRSILFLICTRGHNQRPLVPTRVPIKSLSIICIYLNLCALQHLFNKVLYKNAS
jgi:hypothetical protein